MTTPNRKLINAVMILAAIAMTASSVAFVLQAAYPTVTISIDGDPGVKISGEVIADGVAHRLGPDLPASVVVTSNRVTLRVENIGAVGEMRVGVRTSGWGSQIWETQANNAYRTIRGRIDDGVPSLDVEQGPKPRPEGETNFDIPLDSSPRS